MPLRPESPPDAPAIAALVSEAFLTAPHADGTEADIVARLRDAGALTLSLVSEGPDGLDGHIAASPVTLNGHPGWAGIGPLAVRPDRQGRGIGAALMAAALDRLRHAGFRGAVLVGDPGYYRRFGFTPHPGLAVPGIPSDYVLGLSFNSQPPTGAIAYHPAFGLDAST